MATRANTLKPYSRLDTAVQSLIALPPQMLSALIDRAIDHLDARHGDPDLECSDAEDDFFSVSWANKRCRGYGPRAAGCPISDPGGGNSEDDGEDADRGLV